VKAILDAVTTLLGFLSAVLPFLPKSYDLFPALNPAIAEDSAPATSLLSIATFAVTCVVARRRPPAAAAGGGLYRLPAICLGIAAASFVGISLLVVSDLSGLSPSLISTAARACYLLFFVGVAGMIGWAVGHCFA